MKPVCPKCNSKCVRTTKEGHICIRCGFKWKFEPKGGETMLKAIIVAIIVLVSSYAYAWTSDYDSNGSYSGYHTDNGNQTRYYDSNGNYSGYSWNR